MYHFIDHMPPTARWPGNWVRPDTFAAEMRHLASSGYESVTLGEVADCWEGARGLPDRPVVISFDDGTEGQFLYALPTLRELAWSGVLHLQVGALGVEGRLDKSMVEAMIAAGWEINSHTITHLELPTLANVRLRWEIVRSRSILWKSFGVPADFFCYPSGKYDERALAVVRSAGYRGATTTKHGLAVSQHRFELARVRVDGSDDAMSLGAKLDALSSG